MDSLNELFQTKQDVVSASLALSTVFSLEEAKMKLPKRLSEAIEEQMSQKKVSFDVALNNIKQYISSLKYIKIYIPFEPSKLFFGKVVSLFLDSKPRYVVDIVVDETLIGGSRVAVDGKYYDYSVASKIDSFIKTH